MRYDTAITLLRSGNRLVVHPTTKAVNELLVPELTYTSYRPFFGLERKLSGKAGESTTYQCFTWDHRNRLATSFGFYDRITRLMKKNGYGVILHDMTPPDNLDILQDPYWDRIFDPTAGVSMRFGQDEFLLKAAANISRRLPARFDCPPGFGKSRLIAYLGMMYPRAKIHVTTKRVPVLERIYDGLRMYLPDVGICYGGKKKMGARVQLFSFDSLHHSTGEADIMICDECFPCDTLVDGKQIKSIAGGDFVQSVNKFGMLERKVVKRLFKRRPSALTRLWLSDGSTLIATPSHPVWVDERGFIPVAGLNTGDQLQRRSYGSCGTSTVQGMRSYGDLLRSERIATVSERGSLLLQGARSNGDDCQPAKDSRSHLQNLWTGGGVYREGTVISIQKGSALLSREEMRGSCNTKADGQKESHAISHDQEKGVRYVEENRASSTCSRRQRSRDDAAGVIAASSGEESTFTSTVLVGVSGVKDEQDSRQRVPVTLQDRSGKSQVKVGDRSGRGFSCASVSETTGQEERGLFTCVRVDRIEILEPGSDGQFGGLCPDGFVYNLEVEGNHTYFANDILVHNCHEAAPDDASMQLAKYDNSVNLGFSATHDMRLDNKDMRVEAIFGPVVYKIPYQEAMEHNLVVPMEVIWSDVVMDANPCSGSDNPVDRKRSGVWRNTTRNEIIAADARLYPDDVQTLITCETIEHVLALKRLLPEFETVYAAGTMSAKDIDYFRRQGLWTPESELMTPEKRSRVTKMFELGHLKKAICNTVWNVGVDFRFLEVLLRADAGASPTMDTQIPGRATRINTETDKSKGRIHDYLDHFDHGFKLRSFKRMRNYAKHGWEQFDAEGKSVNPPRQAVYKGNEPGPSDEPPPTRVRRN